MGMAVLFHHPSPSLDSTALWGDKSCMLLASLVQNRLDDLRYRMQLHSIDENIGQNVQTWSFKRREMLVDIYPLIPPQKRPRHIADGGLECFIGTPSLPSARGLICARFPCTPPVLLH